MNIFLDYMTREIKRKEEPISHGPVITISRQFGCYGTAIAKDLTEKINKLNKSHWDYVTKEILEEASKKLEVSENEIAHLFGAKNKGFFGNLILSFGGKSYANESIVISTIFSVVRKFCEQGNIIIVGRAGCTIAKDIEKALHVRIVAPLDYRNSVIKKRFGITEKEAFEKVRQIDIDRNRFMTYFKEQRQEKEIFDMILSRQRMTIDEISQAIIAVAEARNLI